MFAKRKYIEAFKELTKDIDSDDTAIYNEIAENAVKAVLYDAIVRKVEQMADDLISRQAAIAIPVTPKEDREYQTFNLDDAYEQGWYDLQKIIEQFPSAQGTGIWMVVSERKKRIEQLPSAQAERRQ